ncbi:MAG: sulfatase [Myxococcota bacterium]
MNKTGLLLAALLAVLLGYIVLRQVAAPERVRRDLNLLIISVDTLRADHLGYAGYARDTSPNIDALAGKGVVFDHVMAQSGSTWPSLTTIMTSLHPVIHGVRANGMRYDEKYPMLPELLKREGYATAGFLANASPAVWRGVDLVRSGFGRDESVTYEAITWLKENADKRFFAWVHLLGPHAPYAPPVGFDDFGSPYDGEFTGQVRELQRIFTERLDLSEADLAHLVSLYDGAIAYTDNLISMLLHTLEQLGLMSNTLIVFTADHGEELYGHDYYFEHTASLYESVLHVPLIFRFPDGLGAGEVDSTLVQSLDIAPTIVDYLGLESPSSFEGESLLPLVGADRSDRAEAASIAEVADLVLSLRTPRYRYILRVTDGEVPVVPLMGTGSSRPFQYEKEELYDLSVDPLERRNLSEERPEVLKRLRERLGAWKEEHWEADGRPIPVRTQNFSPIAVEQLRALGYL